MGNDAKVTYDVLIVGGGTAGLPAAFAAAERGARVAIVEGTSRLGGTCAFSWGQMSGGGTRIQARKGIEDSAAMHYEDAKPITGGTAKDAFLRLATELQGPLIDWLEDEGMVMAPDVPGTLFAHEPYTAARLYWGNDRGQSILEVLLRLLKPHIESGRVDVRLGCEMTALVTDDGGAVRGIRTSDGQEILASNTVLTAGGYAANEKMFAAFHPDYKLYPGTWTHTKGSGIEAARGIGAATWNGENFSLAWAGFYDTTKDYPRYCGIGGLTPQARKPWEILVNQEGLRFQAEDEESYDRRERVLRAQTGNRAWLIFDDTIRQKAPRLFIRWSDDEVAELYKSSKSIVRATTLEELARKCGIEDEAALKRTIESYNRACDTGKDEFGRKHFPCKILNPPFVAVEIASYAVRGPVGLKVDIQFRVLDGNDRPIPNLYAAGEILGGGLFGKAAVAGMGITPALAFGKYLGEMILPL